MTSDVKARAALAETKAAKATLLADLDILKHRVTPSVIVGDAVDSVKAKSSAIAADLVGTAKVTSDAVAADASDIWRRQPAMVSGVGVLAVLLVLVPLWRRRRKYDATPIADASFTQQRAYRPEEGLPS